MMDRPVFRVAQIPDGRHVVTADNFTPRPGYSKEATDWVDFRGRPHPVLPVVSQAIAPWSRYA